MPFVALRNLLCTDNPAHQMTRHNWLLSVPCPRTPLYRKG